MTELRWGSATDVGRVRTNNEDSLIASPGLFAIADGMGGHSGGEIASSEALRTLEVHFVEATVASMVEAAEEANLAVLDKASTSPDLRGMGTTLVALAPLADGDDHEPGALGWINVGDSRLYLLRDGDLTQVSTDHSLVEEAVRSGQLTAAEARTHPQRNIVTRGLGIDPNVLVDAGIVDPYVGDRFLLCSDGLSDAVEDDRIAAIMRRYADPDEVAAQLVVIANDAGGRDNISVVVVDVTDDGDKALAASRVVSTQGPAAATRTAVHDLAGFTTAPASPETDGAESDGIARAEVDPASPAIASAGTDGATTKVRKPRRITWRVVLFSLLVVAVVGGAGYAVWWQARGSYYIQADDHGQIQLYRGKPGGVLWIDPAYVSDTGTKLDDVPPSRHDALRKGIDVSDADDADEVLRTMREARQRESGGLTTTTTTTVAGQQPDQPGAPTAPGGPTADPDPPTGPPTTAAEAPAP